jgi:DNA invertase Pin-like site-specific DNA recombinase
MLTVLGGLAEFERDLIRTRTGEGRERAKARKPKLTVHQRQEAIKRRDVDGEPIRDIARSYSFRGKRFRPEINATVRARIRLARGEQSKTKQRAVRQAVGQTRA